MSEPHKFPQDMVIELPNGNFILIPFTREEWEMIALALEEHEVQWLGPEWAMEVNIIDRIEKRLGIE